MARLRPADSTQNPKTVQGYGQGTDIIPAGPRGGAISEC